MGMGTQPMGMGMATSGVRNMNLPMSSARPIEVDENTPNLEEIQGFPVAGTAADGTHFHQDPVSGQMYRMSTDLHQRIPEIIRNRQTSNQEGLSNTATIDISNVTIEPTTETSSLNTVVDRTSSISNASTNTFLFGDEDLSINFDFFQEDLKYTGDYYNNFMEMYGITSQYYTGESIDIVNIMNNANDVLFTTPTIDFNRSIPINMYVNSKSTNILTDYSTRYIPINIFYNGYGRGGFTNNRDSGNLTRIVLSEIIPNDNVLNRSSQLVNSSISFIGDNTPINRKNTQTEKPITSAVHVFTRFNGQRHIIIKDFGDIAPDGMYLLEDCMDDGAGGCMVEFSYGYGPGVTRIKYRYPAPCECDF